MRLFLAAVAIFSTLGSTIADAIEPAELLATLRKKDEALGNVRLAYSLRETTKNDYLSVDDDLQNRPYLCHEEMVVRGELVSFHRDRRTVDISPASPWASVTRNNFGGIQNRFLRLHEQFTVQPSALRFTNPGVLEVPHWGAESVTHDAAWIEFALGVGFGKRLLRLDTVEATSNRWKARGALELSPGGEMRCDLEIDENYLVRTAVLNAVKWCWIRHAEMNCTGVVARDGFVLAERGHQLLRHNTLSIEKEFDIHLESARFHLTDDEYRQLTNLDLPEGVCIFDLEGVGVDHLKDVSNIDAVRRGARVMDRQPDDGSSLLDWRQNPR